MQIKPTLNVKITWIIVSKIKKSVLPNITFILTEAAIGNVLWKKCSCKFNKILGKTAVSESPF